MLSVTGLLGAGGVCKLFGWLSFGGGVRVGCGLVVVRICALSSACISLRSALDCICTSCVVVLSLRSCVL